MIAVAVGGAVGSVARYLVALGAARWLGTAFPYGTLAVNVVGCAIVAFVLGAALENAISPALRLALTTGFCGGFTTYSAFNYEVIRLAEDGRVGWAGIYAVLTLVLCGVAGLLGAWAARGVV